MSVRFFYENLGGRKVEIACNSCREKKTGSGGLSALSVCWYCLTDASPE